MKDSMRPADVESPERKQDAYELENLENTQTLTTARTYGTLPDYSDADMEKVIRKLDYRLLPFLLLLYTFSVLDRSNLGNAKLAGMTKDIDLGGIRYNWLGTIFYIFYIVSQPAILGWKQFPAHYWCASAVLFWGIIATVQAAANSWGGLMACRALLGIAEAMFGPGVPLYLSYFYPRSRIGFRHGVFISGSALANAYGSTLAYGITQIKGSLGPWRILFLIEGLPTILLAVWTFFYLPDSIMAAKFLNDREKEIAKHMVGRNQILEEGEEKKGANFKDYLAAFLDPKAFATAIMYFSVNVGFASLPLFVPTIISELGQFTTVQSQGLTAPPYVLCFFMILIAAWLTDKIRVRGPFVTIFSLIAAVGYILLGTCDSVAARYLGIFLAIEIFVCVSLLLTWTANIHATESKRAGSYTVLGLIGQCGPVLGTNLFPASEKPYYRKGAWVSCGMCFVIAITSMLLSAHLIRENRMLEREGLVAEEGEIMDAPGAPGARVKRYKNVC